MTTTTKTTPEAARGIQPDDIYDMAAEGDSFSDPELEKRVAEMVGQGALSKLQARYKVEVIFTGERSMLKPYPGFIVIWTNGDYQQAMVYLCPKKDENNRPCNAPLTAGMISQNRGVAICPNCRGASAPKELTGQIFARLTTQGWAKLVVRVFGLLECNTDIEITHVKKSVRAAEARSANDGGTALHKIHDELSVVTYTLNRIVADSANGADVLSLVRAFIEA
jgi:hypothetical protein